MFNIKHPCKSSGRAQAVTNRTVLLVRSSCPIRVLGLGDLGGGGAVPAMAVEISVEGVLSLTEGGRCRGYLEGSQVNPQ